MESPGPSNSQRSFKRSYVACVSCRTRKSRCIVKDKPPCNKCEREHRECRFDHRQRGPKHREPPKWTQQETATTSRQHPLPEVQLPGASPKQLDVSLGGYQGDALGFSQSPNNTGHSLYDRVRSSIVTGTNDALDILSDAVDRQRSVAASTPSQPTNGPKITPGVSLRASGLVHSSRGCHVHGSPLSPVIVDQFRSHSAHTHLIHEEAMLCCTILTIASRFFMLPGAGGTSRSHNIHQRLWSHCEMLIKRILLGQEKTSTAKTRAIGTVESLMLISDWHPRALHFPPETDGWDALLISPGYDPVNRRRMNDEAPLIRWKDDVFEPAKRANRMSWMLLGMANNLAYELGVISSQRPEASRSTELQVIRSLRAQKLLYVYLTQTATRLGYPSVFPESIAVTASRLLLQNSDEPAHRSWTAYMDLSVELTQLSRTASSMFFQSAAHLQSQVLGDHYADLLEHFAASLSKWQQKYDSLCKGRSGSCRHCSIS
ncbi:hypothetical protein LRP88_09191 [Fusarium phalaenopsidis]